MIKLKIFSTNEAGMNSYLLFEENEAVLIDPGFNGKEIMDFLKVNSINLTKVFLTHAHFDHIRDIIILNKEYDFQLYIHEKDVIILKNNNYNYAKFFAQNNYEIPSDLDIKPIREGKHIQFRNITFDVIWTPGHTQGSVCFKYLDKIFTGDTLFADSIGRTDLFSGSMQQMNKSLKILNDKVSNNVTVYPGHGRHKVMSEIKKYNQFLLRLN